MNKIMSVVGFTAASLASAAAQTVDIRSSVKEGDRLSGTVEIRVTVVTKSTVNQVEFYINDNLRHSDTSTPYTYKLDTVVEKEGPLTLEIAAFTAAGDSKREKLNLVVDNGVDKGAKFHVESARSFLNVAKFDEAIQAARVALKADENSVPAKLAMARAYLGKGVLDRAQQWAEDAVVAEESVEANELLGGIHAERAFRIVSMSGDKGDALKEIAAALKAAVTQKQAALNSRLKEMGTVTDENRLKVVDLLLRKHDYSAARRHLSAKWRELHPDTPIGNRLIYANMRSGRMAEAYKIAKAIQTKGTPDATTWALLAAGHAYYRHWDDATEAIRNGGFDDEDAPTLMTSSAYNALLRGDRPATLSQIKRMLDKHITVPEVYYYLFVLQYGVGQFSESRDNFRKSVIQDPLLYDAYVARGYQALLNANTAPGGVEKDKDLLYDQARVFFEVALGVRPDSAEALNGLALSYLYQNKLDKALEMARAAAGAGPEFPWAHFTLSAAYSMNRMIPEAQKAVDVGGPLDKVVLEGRSIPSLEEAWHYSMRYARLPVIIPPK